MVWSEKTVPAALVPNSSLNFAVITFTTLIAALLVLSFSSTLRRPCLISFIRPGMRLIVAYFSPSIFCWMNLKGARIAHTSSTIIHCSVVRFIAGYSKPSLTIQSKYGLRWISLSSIAHVDHHLSTMSLITSKGFGPCFRRSVSADWQDMAKNPASSLHFFMVPRDSSLSGKASFVHNSISIIRLLSMYSIFLNIWCNRNEDLRKSSYWDNYLDSCDVMCWKT